MSGLEPKTMFQEGQQALYCLGDTTEQVTILKIHPDSITILIPSTNKERDTLPERLKPIVEKRQPTIDKFFGKPCLELIKTHSNLNATFPVDGIRTQRDGTKPIIIETKIDENWSFQADYMFHSLSGDGLDSVFAFSDAKTYTDTERYMLIRNGRQDSIYIKGQSKGRIDLVTSRGIGIFINIKITHHAGKYEIFVNNERRYTFSCPSLSGRSGYIIIGQAFGDQGLDATIKNVNISSSWKLCNKDEELFINITNETQSLYANDNVLLENQKLMFNQLNALQETVKSLTRKDEQRETELWALRQMLTTQKEIHELELKELRKLIKTDVEPVLKKKVS